MALTVEVFVVGGGGAGAYGGPGGGGGGGGVSSTSLSLALLTAYPVVIGAGGTNVAAGSIANPGGASSIAGFAVGGGGGGAGQGGGYSGQGYPPTGENQGMAGGGGGAGGAAPPNPGVLPGAAGGPGYLSSFDGVSRYYGPGGGGGVYVDGGTHGGGPGGTGGGGYGAGCSHKNLFDANPAGMGSVPGAGGGGGGSMYGGAAQDVSPSPAGGRAGIVIIRYPGSTQATGGSITSSGGYTIHTFTSDGAFMPVPPPTITSLVPYVCYRGEDTYINIYGTNFTPQATIGMYSNGGLSLVSGTVYGAPTNIAVTIRLAANAALGANHIINVTTAGGTTEWAYIYAYDRPPVISQVDNTTTPAYPDAVFVQGTSAYTHFWGNYLYYAGITGTVSGAGVNVTRAADGGPTLIAMTIAVANDAPLGNRTLYLTTPGGGNSNVVTITIIAPVPTLTGIAGIGGAAAQGFVGVPTRVRLTGSGYKGVTVTINAPGITITEMSVESDTSVVAIFTGTTPITRAVSVTTQGGTSGTLNFTVLTATALPSAGLIINQVRGPAVNNHPGPLGLHLTVGADDRTVTHLGRWKIGGNDKKHTLWLRNDQWQPIATATLDMAQGAPDTWVYAPISPPVLVRRGGNYLLADMSTGYQQDTWAQLSSVVSDGNGKINGVLAEVQSMFSFTRGTDRTDTVSVGFRFTATAAYNVFALGRWKLPGNNLAHRVVLKDANGTILRETVVDFTGNRGVENTFNYAPITGITLTAGATYFVLADEGGDVWPDIVAGGNVPWGGLTLTGACYETAPVVNGVVPNTNPAANSMWGCPDVLCLVGGWSNIPESYVTMNLRWEPVPTAGAHVDSTARVRPPRVGTYLDGAIAIASTVQMRAPKVALASTVKPAAMLDAGPQIWQNPTTFALDGWFRREPPLVPAPSLYEVIAVHRDTPWTAMNGFGLVFNGGYLHAFGAGASMVYAPVVDGRLYHYHFQGRPQQHGSLAELELWIDGVRVGQVAGAGPLTYGSADHFVVGNDLANAQSATGFPGYLSEVALFSRWMNQYEIADLFKSRPIVANQKA